MRSSNIDPEMEDYDVDAAFGGMPARAQNRRRVSTTERAQRPVRRPTPDADGPANSRRPRRQQTQNHKQKKESYNIISFFTDERTHFAAGIILCIVAIVMTICSISFLFNHATDQSALYGRTMAEAGGAEIENAGNVFGATLAHWLMVDSFGLGSFILALYLFVIGISCLGLKRVSFWPLSFRCLFSATSLSIIIGLITFDQENIFPLGGNHGYYINKFLIGFSGYLGAYAVSAILVGLLVAVFLYPIKRLLFHVRQLLPQRKVVEEVVSEFDQPDGDGVSVENAFNVSNENDPEEGIDADSNAIPQEHLRFTPQEALDTLGGENEIGDDVDIAQQEITEATGQVPAVAFGIPQERNITEKALSANGSDSGSGVPADPELIIVNHTQEEAEEEPEVQSIRHGDRITADQPYDHRASHSQYVFPSTELLIDRGNNCEINPEEQAHNKTLIVNALRSFNIEIMRIEATIGPTVTLYEIVPAEGTRIAKIKSLEDDIAMSLAAPGIRIIAPMPGKGTIGIEVPNRKPQMVSMKTVLESKTFKNNKYNLPMALGSTISNDIFIADLTKMPHLLVAGATGQGKSVGLNCIITSLLYSKHPDELKFVLIDPKMVEFTLYRRITNAFLAKLPEEDKAIITDPDKVIATLNSLCVEMDKRYELLSDAGVRSLEQYNERFEQRRLNPANGHRYLPYIVMIVDEFADLIMTAGKDISAPIGRIAQKARAVGMHMILATQRPSTDIITGMIKANFPARIAFRVLSSIDSKTILDRPGAHRLIGRGDMLTLINGATERVQCAFVDTEEIEAICEHIDNQPGFVEPYSLPEPMVEESGSGVSVDSSISKNKEFTECALFIASQNQASITMLQRKFEIGFNKAGRYMDQMEALGIVGHANGQKPREVLMTPEEVRRLLMEQ